VLQGESLYTISGKETLESLKGEPFFWIDVNGPTEADLALLAEVRVIPQSACVTPL
jgi:Mg2+ and Co2+ transporter CorA